MSTEEIAVHAAELEEHVENGELRREEYELLVELRQIEITVVAEVAHHIDNTGRYEGDDHRLDQEEPRMGLREGRVAHDHAHVAEKDNGTDHDNNEEIRQNHTGTESGNSEFEGDSCRERPASKHE